VLRASFGENGEGRMTETLSTIFVACPGRSRRRVGRGIGSGRGKTSGYGHKGARARAGGTKCAFEGGQMPIYRRLPKRGFTPLEKKETRGIINLQDLQRLVDENKVTPAEPVTLDVLKACGAVRRSISAFRLLGKGKISVALKIEAIYVTPSASRAIVAAGGKVLDPASGDIVTNAQTQSVPEKMVSKGAENHVKSAVLSDEESAPAQKKRTKEVKEKAPAKEKSKRNKTEEKSSSPKGTS
jgi:large subunit ribosomal protein L15